MPVKVAGGVLPLTIMVNGTSRRRDRQPAPAAGRSAGAGLCPADGDGCDGRGRHSCRSEYSRKKPLGTNLGCRVVCRRFQRMRNSMAETYPRPTLWRSRASL